MDMHKGKYIKTKAEILKDSKLILSLFLEFLCISFFADTVRATTCVHAGLLSEKGMTPIPLPL